MDEEENEDYGHKELPPDFLGVVVDFTSPNIDIRTTIENEDKLERMLNLFIDKLKEIKKIKEEV